ncbi:MULTISPECIES: asparaginase [Aneurinibacillus]|uniref:asparaginase n=1 Tax=Aneurinibacillus thermoaerophilus TaxID=143495 RepID=A0A1G8EVH2_ANETH|nr:MULTISPECIES: asparaginase [Aneurinibacillus]AMA73351.1 L-asparaginase 1 [Aneurinibacillus sp. XH2]MED0676009.1 asparaginase [Aneurinibacillus thermoaerophilus]MED0680555.1 asparaginase [Aneurinibacillus thermoaerophilus]MED0736292.1 asparaginase [Aneurinibacillus thermoaerophilus]MED0758053.1 asparaginase [Aneurinibacillus thermoaerophilus]
MKKLLLLATGGTIASVEGKEGLTPGISADELLRYLPEEQGGYHLESKTVMNIDSTNMQPEYWAKIAEAIHEHYADYDGFVITHGTDTMGYTAAALSYMLQNLGKPVVLTGSQVPIYFKKTDAKKNFIDAVRFACEDVAGVFVVFDGRVIKGTRAVKMRTQSYDAFESINFPYVAYINDTDITYNMNVSAVSKRPFTIDTSLCPDVLLLKLYPGMQPELFDAIKHLYKGIIIESFGNGGIPHQERNLLPKIKELIDAGIAVVITTQCIEEGEHLTLYEVGRKVAQNMIIHSHDMNTEAIVPKLMWVLGKTNDLTEVKRMMETPISDDMLVKSEIEEE